MDKLRRYIANRLMSLALWVDPGNPHAMQFLGFIYITTLLILNGYFMANIILDSCYLLLYYADVG